jgi:hypothetical protein
MSERRSAETKQMLLAEIDHAPEAALRELLDYAQFLRAKRDRVGLELAMASESALSKDWLSPEEDEAWAGL